MADLNSIALPYGRETLFFDMGAAPEVLDIREPEPVIDSDIFRARLLSHLSRADLNLAHPVVVVADKTRLCGYAQYLPVLLAALAEAGANMARLKIAIAYGTHARQSEAQCRQAYGPAYGQADWVHHDCEEMAAFVELGHTRRGTPVRLRRDIVEASCVITFGAISHHYFAGFGGGRKLIFPGLGEKAAIHANHGLFLDSERRRTAAGCQPGMLAGNPLAEDLAEYETFRPADVAVHGILNSHGRVCDLRVGQGAGHFLSACARHDEGCMVSGGPYDLVLASCGGFPKDINFIQSHKAIHNAAAFVRDGGLLIVLAHCADGIGSDTFMPWFEMGDRDAAFDRLANHYVGNGGTALAMMDKLRRIRIGVVTQLEPATAARIGFEWLSVARARQAVAAQDGGSTAVIPNAGMVVRARSAENE
jgi:lactate racemase